MINNYNEFSQLIDSNDSISIVRLGNVEMSAILQDKGIYDQMYSNAGFYGEKKDYQNWKNKYVRALYNSTAILDVYSCKSFEIQANILDKLNIWKSTLPYIEMPDYYIRLLIDSKYKEINVISYFKKDIDSQLKYMNKIWNHKINKKFTVFKSENTIRGNEIDSGWTETFDKLCKSLGKCHGKLYLVSCGCYGLPVCDYIRENGGKAIYLGGLLQTLFGLKGNRFDKREEYNRHYNSYWKYPSEKPKGSENVEGGCYWENKNIK